MTSQGGAPLSPPGSFPAVSLRFLRCFTACGRTGPRFPRLLPAVPVGEAPPGRRLRSSPVSRGSRGTVAVCRRPPRPLRAPMGAAESRLDPAMEHLGKERAALAAQLEAVQRCEREGRSLPALL